MNILITGGMVNTNPNYNAPINIENITECSLISGKSGVCSSEKSLEVMKSISGVNSSNPADIVAGAKKVLNCDSEKCILSKPEFQNKRGVNETQTELFTNFKIKGPTDVKLLSNKDIDKILEQFRVKFPFFYHCEFAMSDWDKYNSQLKSVSLVDIYAKNFKVFGFVWNTDLHTGGGIHWIATVVDFRDSNRITMEFYNSSGNPPCMSMMSWFEKEKCKLEDYLMTNKINTVVEYIKVTSIRHQDTRTECGVYALYYIYCRLAGVPYDHFCKNIVHDFAMFKFRHMIFEDPAAVFKPGDVFEIKKYLEEVKTKWE
jgi:hypothetical protein